MRVLFIESSEFTAWVSEFLPDDSLRELQRELTADPSKGKPMPGCGGLRKLRVPDPRRGKGRRGGIRVIYLNVPQANVIFLMDIYDKGEQEDLSADEKASLRELADHFRRSIIARTSGETVE
jgi:hypothetical protein